MSFIRRSADRVSAVKENLKGGPGRAVNMEILSGADEMYGKGRLFNEIVLDKNCGVGWHIHEGDGEAYLMLSGECEYDDNGTVTTIKAGDVTFTGDGEGHAITNLKDEPAYLIALILYK